MRVRTRKLIGTITLMAFLTVYCLIAMSIGAGRIVDASTPVQVLYFLVAGLLWVIPAGVLVRWMQRPDKLKGG